MRDDAGRQPILISPGPVHVFPESREGLGDLHHRSNEFKGVVRETVELLRELLGTAGEVHLLASSGTGGMEAAVANLTAPGERVLVVSGGKFGDRWGEICGAFECETIRVSFPKGAAIDAAKVAAAVDREHPGAVFITHVESSTGALFPLRDLCARVSGRGALLVVDAISSIGAEELEMDAWGIDAVVGASQKSLASPVGVSFAALGPRAAAALGARRKGRYYFDLSRARKGLESGETPFTPAIETTMIMHRTLRLMRAAGFAGVVRRHGEASRAFLDAAGRLGLRPFPERPSSAVQALVPPAGCSAETILEGLSREGFIAAAGQDELRGVIFRTGFLGLFGAPTLRRLVEALGRTLRTSGCGPDVKGALDEFEEYPYETPLFGTKNA